MQKSTIPSFAGEPRTRPGCLCRYGRSAAIARGSSAPGPFSRAGRQELNFQASKPKREGKLWRLVLLCTRSGRHTRLCPDATEVLRLGQRLPSSPQVFNRISRLSSDPNSNLPEIARLVETRRGAGLAGVAVEQRRLLWVFRTLRHTGRKPSIGWASRDPPPGRRRGLAASVLRRSSACTGCPAGWLENSVACALAMEWLTAQQDGDEAAAYAIGLLRRSGSLCSTGC